MLDLRLVRVTGIGDHTILVSAGTADWGESMRSRLRRDDGGFWGLATNIDGVGGLLLGENPAHTHQNLITGDPIFGSTHTCAGRYDTTSTF